MIQRTRNPQLDMTPGLTVTKDLFGIVVRSSGGKLAVSDDDLYTLVAAILPHLTPAELDQLIAGGSFAKAAEVRYA